MSEAPVDALQTFDSPTEYRRFVDKMPKWYDQSQFVKDFMITVTVEMQAFRILLAPYHTSTIGPILTNDEGWGFETLFAQSKAVLANHYIPKWADLIGITPDKDDKHKLTKERFRVLLEHSETNNPLQLRQTLAILFDTPLADVVIDETYADYFVTITVLLEDLDVDTLAELKIRNTVPAHLAGDVFFYHCALDDSPPCELGDPDAILGSSFQL